MNRRDFLQFMAAAPLIAMVPAVIIRELATPAIAAPLPTSQVASGDALDVFLQSLRWIRDHRNSRIHKTEFEFVAFRTGVIFTGRGHFDGFQLFDYELSGPVRTVPFDWSDDRVPKLAGIEVPDITLHYEHTHQQPMGYRW